MLISPNLRLDGGVSRLAWRLRDPAWRRYGRLLLLGKLLGLLAVATVILGLPLLLDLIGGTHAYAQQTAAKAATQAVATPSNLTTAVRAGDPYVNPINTVWVLIASFLVFCMQAGFTMLKAGLCRSRETVNVLVECVFDTCLCGLLFWAWGYAFMFGAGNALIGWHDPADSGPVHSSWFFLQNITATTTYGTTGVPVLAHWLFQFAFADCASTICSGAMVGRTCFWGDIFYSVGVSGFLYPVIGHWCWGPDGFLAGMGTAGHWLPALGVSFHDFAGSTVVHSIGGWIGLAGAVCLGPRLGRVFKRDGGGPLLPHDLTIAVVGGLVLWFGWYGFNPGSTLSAMDTAGIGRVAANTTLAACAGGVITILIGYFLNGIWDAALITNGLLAGLVAITASCYWVSPTGAVVLGGIAGVIVIVAVELLEFFRIDDPIGAWPVHGACGIWGTLSVGFFATGEHSAAGSSPTGVPLIDAAHPALAGLFYGGGVRVLAAQAVGSAVVVLSAFSLAMLMFGVLRMANLLRVSAEGEMEGLDIHEHGISAYPEFVVSSVHAPQGLPAHAVHATARPTAAPDAAPHTAVRGAENFSV